MNALLFFLVVSIVINGDLYGYGTESFGGTPKLKGKHEKPRSVTTTPKVQKKLEATV